MKASFTKMKTNSIDIIYDHILNSSVTNIPELIRKLEVNNSINDIFLGASLWYSLQKTGYFDDKANELFSELSRFCFSVNIDVDTLIEVYRGCAELDYIESGVSWTLNKHVATWFATRHNSKNPIVAKMTINSNLCLGLISGAEQEVLIHPENIESFELIDFDYTSKPSLITYLGNQ